MSRKSSFWKSLGRKSQKSRQRHGWRKRANVNRFGSASLLGFEPLEPRVVLSTNNPVVSVVGPQVFGEDMLLHIRDMATFTDTFVEGDTVADDTNYQVTVLIAPNPNGGAPVPTTGLATIDNGALNPGEIVGGSFDGDLSFANTGVYTVSVTVQDPDGGVGSNSFQVTIEPTASDIGVTAPPEIPDSNGATGYEGSEYVLTLSNNNSNIDTINQWTIHWGDGQTSTVAGTESTATHVYADDNQVPNDNYYVINAEVSTEDGHFWASGQASFVRILNVAPDLSISSNTTDVNEGDQYSIDLSLIDPGDDHVQIWVVAWESTEDNPLGGAEQFFGELPPSVSHVYADGDADYTVLVLAQDEDGLAFSNTLNISVHNIAPTADAGGPYTVAEGSSVTLNGLGSTDAAGDIPTLIYEWDMDSNGHFDDPGDVTGPNAVFDATGIDGNATYTINLRVTDQDGASSINTTTLTVANVAPTLAISGAASVNEGSSYTLNLSKSDPGTDTISQWTINWGDGTQIVSGNPSSVSHTYADGSANYTVSATATDEDGTYAAGNTVAVTVNNVTPTLTISGAASVNEGSSYMLNLSSADPGADTISQWTINWGDSIQVVSGNPSSTSHTYADNSVGYTISAKATDEDGTFDAGNTVSVTVNNVVPTATFSGGGTVNEGSAGGTVSFSGQSDPSTADTSAGFHYAYDFNGDGTFDVGDGSYGGSSAAPSQPVPASFLADGTATHNIKGRIIDKDGGFTDYTAAIIVLNVVPTLTLSGGASVNEGSSYALNLSSFDPGADTITSWTINWGDATPAQIVSGNPSSVSHTYADGSASYTISATATDEDGIYNAGNTVTVAVNNVAPTLVISGAVSINEGSSYTLNLSKSDPGVDTISKWTINWGDATPVQIVSGSPSSVSHVYADGSASYTISATATDEDGTFTAGNTVGVIVNNVVPTVAISGAASVNEGSTYTLNLSKSDPGADTINHWTINWGDGTQTVSGSPTSVTHVYADGTINYTISATATDEDGTFAAGNTVAVTVFNVAPTANAGGPYATFDDAPITLTGSGTDPAGTFDPLTFQWDLDGDNIFGETGSGAARGNEVGPNVIYNPAGLPTSTQTVKLRVSDGDGGLTTTTTTVQILGQGTLAIGGVLYIVGSNTANDIVLITQCNNTITVLATFNSNNPMTFNASTITDIQVRTRGGNDIVITTSDVMETMTIDGGSGNDLLTGGGARSVIIGGTGNDILYGAAGNDVLLGGDGNDDIFGGDGNDVLVGGNGNDILDGGSGRDVLIGSQDEDCLNGGNDEDILIGGYTVHDNNVAALDTIMAIWGSSASFSSRVATLSGSGGMLQAGTKVFDDDDHDNLVGDAGRDLYFGDNNPADHVTDSISLQALQDQLIAVT